MTEWEALLRLGVAIVLGGAIGFERETLDQPAGFRTHMLVCLGAAMFMVGSVLLVESFGSGPEMVRVDPSRIGSTIVSGIGFLGAGIIFKNERRVTGLTTAAGLWVAAAVGMVTGAGFFIVGIGGTVMALVVLVIMRRVELLLDLKDEKPVREMPEVD